MDLMELNSSRMSSKSAARSALIDSLKSDSTSVLIFFSSELTRLSRGCATLFEIRCLAPIPFSRISHLEKGTSYSCPSTVLLSVAPHSAVH